MTTINPAALTDTGDVVLAAAKTTDTKPIRAKLAAFTKQHAAFVAAETKVRQAEARLRAQEAKVADADTEQDALVEELARARIADGASRTRPFKPLGFDGPSAIRKMGDKKEALLVRKLAKKAATARGASKGTIAAAKALDKAGAAVLATIAPIHGLEKAYADALSVRNALAQPWATSLAMLKRAARVAEDDGARGLFATLFKSGPPTRTSKTKRRGSPATPPPDPPSPPPTDGASDP